MSTDDFEARLRARLADLADAEDDWADPQPEARRRAAALIAADDAAPLGPPTPPRRRRWLPTLAIAATVATVLAAGGFGVQQLVTNSGSGASDSAAGAAFAESCAQPVTPCNDEVSAPASDLPGSGDSATDGSATVAGCGSPRKAVSTGPLADVATIRPSGIATPTTTSGGSAGIGYQLTFGESGGSVQVRPAQALWSQADLLCEGPPGVAGSNAIQVVPVRPGAGVSGSVVFTAVDSAGTPLAAGTYAVRVVIAYTDPAVSGGPFQLVSPPVPVVVS